MARSSTWKSTERQVASILGGRRVPLSGSNSGHETQSDVMGIPDWLYVEVKGDKQYNSFLSTCYEICKKDLVALTSSGLAIGFLSPRTYRSDVVYIDDLIGKRNPPAISLYQKELPKAKKEGKEILIVVFRLHNKKGFLFLTEYIHYDKLFSWFTR